MLLTEFNKLPDTTFKKINQHLETNYGFKISEDVSDQDLGLIVEKIENEIIDLKLQGNDAKASPEISKRLLILEGIKTLREYAIIKFQSPDLEKVVGGLAEYVADMFRISGTTEEDFDDCIKDGMKHYRSSKYRFPDEMIEERVREAAMSRVCDPMSANSQLDIINYPLVGEEDQYYEEISEEKWIKTDPKKAGMFKGRNQASLKAEREKLKAKHAKQEGPVSDADKERMAQLNFAIRAKSKKGLGENIKFSKEDKKENVMKENIVRKLRMLLETEVSQAEVMMAAKGFAQELQEMIEKIGRLQNEDLPPVTDQMRETYGTASSSAFQTQIYGALQGVMDALYTAKAQVDDSVSNMAETGQVTAQVDMDKSIDMGDGTEIDTELSADLDNLAGADTDEFGGAEEEEPLGRAKKMESLENKVLEMRKLVEKAKKLKEAKRLA